MRLNLFVARLEQIKNTSGVGYFFESAIPTLAHRGNVSPAQDEDAGKI